ncbi:MAG: hypothetical protein PF450_11675, partial [Bacteroidales bacterium]|nr:hypothetical protein [Bacteroidales bacterium]
VISAYTDDWVSGVILFEEVFYDQILPKYSEDEFLEKLKTLKVFRISERDSVFYGNSANYCLEMENWHIDYSEDDGFGRYEYFLRLGFD